MAEEVFSDIPEELHASILSGDELVQGAQAMDAVSVDGNMNMLESTVSVSRSQSTTASLSQLPSENGVSFGKILSFAGSCSINLVLPFINGLMLGFGELVAHEISWDWNWFSRNNKGFRVFPESRKLEGASNDNENNDKFL